MLVAEPVPASAQQRYHCLDLLKVTLEDASQPLEDAVLLEVWEAGGLLQTGRDIPRGTSFQLACSNGGVLAKVASCGQDDYGYLVEFTVDSRQAWFPQAYRPPYMLPERACDAPNGR